MTTARDPRASKQLGLDIHEATGAHVPSHVVNRIALLAGAKTVRYLEAPLERQPGLVSGTVRVFTDDVLIVVDLDDVATQSDRDGHWGGKVTVAVVPRASLLTLHVAPGRGHENRNDNSLWAGSEVLRWPNFAEVELRYPELEHPVVLGTPGGGTSGFGGSPLDGFLDSLVADLYR